MSENEVSIEELQIRFLDLSRRIRLSGLVGMPRDLVREIDLWAIQMEYLRRTDRHIEDDLF